MPKRKIYLPPGAVQKQKQAQEMARKCKEIEEVNVQDNYEDDISPLERPRRSIRHMKKEVVNDDKLNTQTFQDYLQNLWTYTSPREKQDFAYLDCLWFADYLEKKSKSKVLPWIAKKSILQKKYVFVPVCYCGHWSLIILCNLGESSENENSRHCIILLDSLLSTNTTSLEPDIRRFSFDIYARVGMEKTHKAIQNIPFLVPKVPQQTNDIDCGYYVLFFIKLFVARAHIPFSLDMYPDFLTVDWFSKEDFILFKKELCRAKGHQDKGSSIPNSTSDETIVASNSVRTRGSNLGTPTPENTSSKMLLEVEGCSFVGSLPSRDIVHTMKCYFTQPWPSWSSVPQEVKECLWQKFESKYTWPEGRAEVFRTAWDKTCQRRFNTMLEQVRREAKKKANSENLVETIGHGPKWMAASVWDTLVHTYWSTDNWQKKSKAGHINRLTEKDGAITKHSGGSISFVTHKQKMSKALGRPVSHLELFERTHKRGGTGEFVDEKSKKILGKYKISLQEKFGGDTSSHPQFDEDSWVKVTGGIIKGRLYGFGQVENPKTMIGTSAFSHSCTSPYVGGLSQEDLDQQIDEKVEMRLKMMLEQTRQELREQLKEEVRQELRVEVHEMMAEMRLKVLNDT